MVCCSGCVIKLLIIYHFMSACYFQALLYKYLWRLKDNESRTISQTDMITFLYLYDIYLYATSGKYPKELKIYLKTTIYNRVIVNLTVNFPRLNLHRFAPAWKAKSVFIFWLIQASLANEKPVRDLWFIWIERVFDLK